MLTYYLLALGIVVVDQVVKYLTVANINLGQTVELIPNILSLTYIRNTGAAWSILEGRMLFFYLITIIVVGVLIYFLHHDAKGKPFYATSIAFLLGGALGNFFDRLRLQYVIDMFQLEFIDFPIFNIADLFITLGVMLMVSVLVYEEFFKGK